MANTPGTGTSEPQAPTPTHGQAIGLILAVIVGVIVFIGLLVPFGIYDFWCGFLFLLYWTSIEHMQSERIAPTLVGGLVGLGIAYMFVGLPPVIGLAAGSGVTLAVIVVAVYCLIMGWLPLFINTPAMLFLTVAGSPEVQHHADFAGAAIALVVGAVFFCGLIKAGTYLVTRRERRRAVGG